MEQIKLEVGKFYSTREGDTIQIVAKRGDPRLRLPFFGSNERFYREDGRNHTKRETYVDLVREVNP
jgi:hypothetical protein